MTLILYTNNSELKKVHKDITEVSTVQSITTNDNVNQLAPEFAISYFPDYNKVNYAYVPELERYYYVVVSRKDSKVISLSLSVDPLMSWKNYFLNGTGCCIRSGGIGKPTDITDTSLPVHPFKYNQTSIVFPVELDREITYVVTTLGSGGDGT